MKIKTNLVTGVVFLLVSAVIFLLIPGQISEPPHLGTGPSPRTIPYIVSGVIFICSIILIIQSLVFKKEKTIEIDLGEEKSIFKIIGCILLFGVLMVTAGYLVAVWVTIPIMLFIMGERKPFIYLFCVLVGTGIYFLFSNIFHITLPGFGG